MSLLKAKRIIKINFNLKVVLIVNQKNEVLGQKSSYKPGI